MSSFVKLGYLSILLALQIFIHKTNCLSDLAANSNLFNSKPDSDGIYLESIEDLEHVSYLSMRNFNITDESLIQSSWLLNIGNNVPHKQHQKQVVSSVSTMDTSDIRNRLALMLESFILHLRNGHLRQLKLEDLRDIAASIQNATQEQNSISSESVLALDDKESRTLNVSFAQTNATFDDKDERCKLLVDFYELELRERNRQLVSSNQQQQQQTMLSSDVVLNQQQDDNSTKPLNETSNNRPSDLATEFSFDRARLIKLCHLVVRCHSADELVSLLDGQWHVPLVQRSFDKRSHLSERKDQDLLEAEPSYEALPVETRTKPRSLRDSLSQSLAKLCPLILFQLHDEDKMCSFRKDDRPPMITVWGFATLFVTIVSFCSLIGLSISPLLVSNVNDPTSSNLETSNENLDVLEGNPGTTSNQINSTGSNNRAGEHHHKACLTLFEGLAVGSLVGSALFSLIPQAFELQERESNQGFLLKALIIFLGIYLFFCSERLMRIILDTRQHRKRKRRGSNSLAVASTTLDGLDPTFPDNCNSTSSFNRAQQQAMRPNSHQKVQMLDFNGLRFSNDQQKQLAAGKRTTSGRDQKGRKQHLDRQQQQQHIDCMLNVGKQSQNVKCVNFSSEQACCINDDTSKLKSVAYAMDQDVADVRSKGNGNVASRQPSGIRTAERTGRVSANSKSRQQVRRRRRRQRRKTRYQLYVQSKRNLNSSQRLTSLRDQYGKVINDNRDKQIQSTYSRPPRSNTIVSGLHRRNSWSSKSSSSDDDIFDSLESHDSSSIFNDIYDNSTSLESSTSIVDSDDAAEEFKLNQHKKQVRNLSRNPVNYALRSNEHPQQTAQINQAQSLISQYDGPSPTNSLGLTSSRPVSANDTIEKQDISTVAWMIILGDGLHNFIDGISIGAAFSESILSGVSISVAVICEEFPHELGDFAVLVSSGMTVRQALGYNFLSACTCYFGMAIGIILGDVDDGASYISALAAGVFLYIALVDMMGELSASLEESSRDSIGKTLKLLLLQNVGIFIGISIILVLSFIDF